MDTLGKRIRQARIAAGLSQGQLGRQCGRVSREAVAQWEADDTKPAVDRMTKIAETTGADLSWLLTGADSQAASRHVMDASDGDASDDHEVPLSPSPPVSAFAEHFGKSLREIRKRRGLTLREVGDRLGVTEGTVSHWENGRREPTMENFRGLAMVLGFSAADLFSETTLVPPPDSESLT